MADVAYVGLDHDGVLSSCASVVDGAWDEAFSTHVVIEISGVNPPGAVVFETAQRRFRTREEGALGAFVSAPPDDAAVHRVRCLQALIDRPSLAGGRPLKVALGLPVQRFFKDLGNGTPNTDYQRHWLSEQEIAVIREPVPAPVNVVARNVASRGIAAYFDWTRDDAGQLRQERSAQVTTVLDVGARDTAILTFTGDRLETERSTLLPRGYLSVLEHLDEALQRQCGVASVRARVLLSILMEGRFHRQGEPHDAMPLLSEGGRSIVDALRAGLEQVDAVAGSTVVVGPAAAVISAGLQANGFDVQVPERPAFANARGMAKFLRGGGA